MKNAQALIRKAADSPATNKQQVKKVTIPPGTKITRIYKSHAPLQLTT